MVVTFFIKLALKDYIFFDSRTSQPWHLRNVGNSSSSTETAFSFIYFSKNRIEESRLPRPHSTNNTHKLASWNQHFGNYQILSNYWTGWWGRSCCLTASFSRKETFVEVCFSFRHHFLFSFLLPLLFLLGDFFPLCIHLHFLLLFFLFLLRGIWLFFLLLLVFFGSPSFFRF